MGLSHINRVQRILLDHGALSVLEILDIIKSQTVQVPTARELNNILAKNPKMFFKAGRQRTKSAANVGYRVVVWAHVHSKEEE